jgi:hypothetical protein
MSTAPLKEFGDWKSDEENKRSIKRKKDQKGKTGGNVRRFARSLR